MLNVKKASENMPVWQREKRQPTRAELADKHAADGGQSSTASGNTLPADDPPGTEYETVPLSEASPHILIRRPIAAPATEIKMRKFK